VRSPVVACFGRPLAVSVCWFIAKLPASAP
jgi:hypothetical protein